MSEKITSNKRILKNTLVLYIRMFFIMLVTLYTSRVVLQVLGVVDFGIYNVVGGVVAMMGVLKGAMATATTRFLTFELGRSDDKQLRKTYCISEMIYALISIVFILFAETVGLWFLNTQLVIPHERMTAANWVYQFTILSVVIEMMAQPNNAVIIAHEKMTFYAYVSILEVVLKLAIVFCITIIPMDSLIVYGMLMMLTAIIVRVVYYVYCKRHFQECKFKIYYDSNLFKRMLSFSGWNLFGSASTLVKGQGLNILLNMFFDPTVNAARGIAFQINGAISQFSQNFYTAVRPQITKYYAQNDLNGMFKLVYRSSKLSFFLNLLLGVPLLIEAPAIIELWLGQLPEYVVIFSRLIIIISLIDAMSHPLMTSVQATENIAFYQSLVGTLNILNLPISYLFLKTGFPPVTVFYISLIIGIISLFARVLIVKRYIPSFPYKDYIVKVILLCSLVGILSFTLPYIIYRLVGESIWEVLFVCIISIISVMVIVYYMGMNKEEKEFVIISVRKLLRR